MHDAAASGRHDHHDAGRYYRAGIVVSGDLNAPLAGDRDATRPPRRCRCGRPRRGCDLTARSTSTALACTARNPLSGCPEAMVEAASHAMHDPHDGVSESAKRVVIAGKSLRSFRANGLVRRQIGLPVVGPPTNPEAAAGRHRRRMHPCAPHCLRNLNACLHAMRNAFFYVLCESAWEVVAAMAAAAVRIENADRRGRHRTAGERARKKFAPDC
jgi:hypothetical protein